MVDYLLLISWREVRLARDLPALPVKSPVREKGCLPDDLAIP
jgi:hypothetical protein